nr:sperm-tail PG-rich repeat-containing protein 2-like isoform X2 [Pelodiscus sinensis]XP_025046564.1 sperm-tail PG-rich repeat-containing protein 2-like isoform X2 [Pelodiscus sinensis]|eukprot:XP_025046563.1 sperm-tail PG-rich repeat-containing protein 2-like isoform X2 [Pelodiscus sinensis]
MPPRTTLAKRKHSSFLSATPRKNLPTTDKNIPGRITTVGGFLGIIKKQFKKILKLCQANLLSAFGQGPGTYNPVAKSASSISLFVSRVERFKDVREITPGPGAYELSPLFKDTVLKRTFNATLQNPIATPMKNTFCKYNAVQPGTLCVST